MKKLPHKIKPILSVIILNYNAKDYLKKLIDSIDCSQLKPFFIEVIIADNASTDSSFALAKTGSQKNPQIKYIFHSNTDNIGFAAGNNQGLTVSNPNSQYVLFLNPDTTVAKNTLCQMIEFFEENSPVDAATCDLILALNGRTQPESHRGFPTPWNAFCHFFGFGLPKLFPYSKLLNGYFLGHLDYSKTQKIDACVGAFFMLKRSVGDSIGWWNDQYFFYGEDLDFCWRLKQLGFSLYFFPEAKAIHYQGISSGGIAQKQKHSSASRATKIKVAQASTTAMRIFYRLNLINHYPIYLRWLVWLGIDLLEFYRVLKAKYL